MYQPTIEYDSSGYARVTERGKQLGVTVQWVDNPRNAGGTYGDDGIDYPFRLVYHEIQGTANPSGIAVHPYPPHLWYRAAARTLYQTVRLARSAFALYQGSDAPYRTNKARAIQVELEGYSDFVANEPESWLNNIAEDVLIPVAQWVATQGRSLEILNLPQPWSIPGSAYENAPQRFTPEAWRDFNGICAHANVPMGDDHWDTGAMDIWRISQHAAYLIGNLLEERDIYMPALFLKDNDDTIWATFNRGYVRPVTLPEYEYWSAKGIETRVLSKDWTEYHNANIVGKR